MLKRLLNLFGSTNLTRATLSTHKMPLKGLSHNGIKVCSELQSAGYEAYMVGGCIRDSLLGQSPKDFDVATNATPEQVRKVFRNARIIGRRFKIVHVRFGREVIEVTTFRGHHSQGKNKEAQQSEEGLLLRDNVYGDISSDAIRRDFTVNALYYDPMTETLLDFTNGLKDIQSRTLRIIGNAEERYREDPVRMLRAARFAAKLGFSVEASTGDLVAPLAELLDNIPSARLFEEVLKLMLSGCATATLETLRQYNLLKHLFPGVEPLIDNSPFNQRFIELVCINTDKRIRQNKRVTPAFIFAAFLWLPLQAEMARLIKSGMKPGEAKNAATGSVISQQLTRTAIPKRFSMPMRDIWYLQHGLERKQPKRVIEILSHQRFRAAYDFILLREDAGEELSQTGQWWTEFQHTNETRQDEMIEALKTETPRRHRKRRRTTPKASDTDTRNTDSNE